MSLLLTLLITALSGLGIGILSGMFGIGGGTMIVPLLHLAFQLPMLNASATSLFTVAPTSIAGTIRHFRQKTVSIRYGLYFGIPGAWASAVSAYSTNHLPNEAIMILAVLVIAYCAFRVFREAIKKPISSDGRTSVDRFKTDRSRILACVFVGLIAGSVAGIIGVGGGFIIVPFGIAFIGMTMKEMSAISLFAIVLIAIPGIIVHAMFGHIWYLYSLALLLGTIPGASLGVYLLNRAPERMLRYLYGILLLASGIMLVVNHIFF